MKAGLKGIKERQGKFNDNTPYKIQVNQCLNEKKLLIKKMRLKNVESTGVNSYLR